VAWQREDYGRASKLFEESLALSREMSNTWWLAGSLSNLAVLSQSRGDYERATELYEESMDLFREQGDKYSLAYCLNNLAMVVYSQGDLGRAGKLTEEAVALFRELRARGDVALVLSNLGWIALLQDDPGRAADHYRESLSIMGDWTEPDNPERLGGICLRGWSKGRYAAGGAAVGSGPSLTRNKGHSKRPRLPRRGRRSHFRCALRHGRGSMGGGLAQGSGDDPG
jgi:tetratricopeptide (TPR) repeat protein